MGSNLDFVIFFFFIDGMTHKIIFSCEIICWTNLILSSFSFLIVRSSRDVQQAMFNLRGYEEDYVEEDCED